VGGCIIAGVNMIPNVITFVLVHGTFASDAKWPRAGSSMRECLKRAAEEAGVRIRFKRVVWSGKNQLAERHRATQRIAAIVNAAIENPARQGERFILVGHSHGGSVIAYHLRQFSKVSDRIIGCIFLSTPFLALRERAGAKELAASASSIVFILMHYFPIFYFQKSPDLVLQIIFFGFI
jgi:pimeloyl-ACP methyl ester carboxylesterase